MASPRRGRTRDPLLSGSPIGAALAAIGLVVVAALTVTLFTGRVPLELAAPGVADAPAAPGPASASQAGPAAPTPVPSVAANPSARFPGSLVFAKAGDLWIEHGSHVMRLTSTGEDSMPAWSPDGTWIYYIETRTTHGRYPSIDGVENYTLDYPVLMRIHPDGTGRTQLLSGLFTASGGQYTFFSWYRQPAVSPDGRTIALVSDAPDPAQANVVLQVLDIATMRLTRVPVPDSSPLGQQDPVWRPDGGAIAYVQNGGNSLNGAAQIMVYDLATHTAHPVGPTGYANPSWSPDGRYLAATHIGFYSTDVVILDAATGRVVLDVTQDGRSWNPVWSPAGNEIVYMHLQGETTDLRLVDLSGTAPHWKVVPQPDLTHNSGLDSASRPAWYVPAGGTVGGTTGGGTTGASPAP